MEEKELQALAEKAFGSQKEAIIKEVDARLEVIKGQIKDKGYTDEDVKNEVKNALSEWAKKEGYVKPTDLDEIKSDIKEVKSLASRKKLGEEVEPSHFQKEFEKQYKANEQSIKAFANGVRTSIASFDMGNVDLSPKAVQKAVDLTSTVNTGGAIQPYFESGVIYPPSRLFHARDAVSSRFVTGTDTYKFNVETTYTGSDAVYAEGSTIGQTSVQFTPTSVVTKKIASLYQHGTELFENIPYFLQYILTRLQIKHVLAEDQELFFGDNTTLHLNGIYTQAPDAANLTFAIKKTNPNYYDVLKSCRAKLASQEYVPNVATVSWEDYDSMTSAKSTVGEYVLGSLGNTPDAPSVDFKIIPSTLMPVGKFLLGDFANAAKIIDSRTLQIMMSYESDNNFQNDTASIRLTSRSAMAVYRPSAFLKGDFEAIKPLIAAA